MNLTISLAEPMLLTDRIIIEIYYDKTAGTAVDLTTFFENAYYSFVQSTFNAGTTLLTSNNNWTGNNHFALSPTVPTVITGDDSTKAASTEFVATAISNITPYIDAVGIASGPIRMADNSINFTKTNGTSNTISATFQSLNGRNSDYITSGISSRIGTAGNAYATIMRAIPDSSVGGLYTTYANTVTNSITELSVSIDGSTPTIGAIIGATSVPITIKSNLDMDQNAITNISSISSSSTISITSTGDMTIGNEDINTNLEGVVNITNDLVVGSTRLLGGESEGVFTTTSVNDIQTRLDGNPRNQIYNAIIPNTSTGSGTIILPSVLNGYYVNIINNSVSDWIMKPQVGEIIGQGSASSGLGNPGSGVIIRPFQSYAFLQVDSGTTKTNFIISDAINGTVV
jgi:hypothetical protein